MKETIYKIIILGASYLCGGLVVYYDTSFPILPFSFVCSVFFDLYDKEIKKYE